MVGARRPFSLLIALALFSSSLCAKDLGDYQIGDKAEQDIVATSKLNFVDVEGTRAEREKEAQRIPVVVRYYPNTADNIEARFRQAFATTQEQFLQSINKAFGHVPLSESEIESLKFESLAMLFQRQNESFPLTTNRAALWAAGDYDKGYQELLATMLRQAMSSVIRPEPTPENFRFGATVRLIPVASTNAVITEQEAAKTNHNFSRTDFASLAVVRRNFTALFPREDRDVARFLANLLEPNSAIDEALTQKMRDESTANVWVVANFEPGQIIARRGQVIDHKIKTAIEQLNDKSVVGKLQELQAKQQAAVGELKQIVAENKSKEAVMQERMLWLVGALAAVVLILAGATWQLSRRRPETLLPVPANGGAEDWQQRALAAEQRTHELQNAARAGLISHLQQWFSRMLTQRLISQRRLLLETHDNAASEMAALEARLQKVQAPLQVRLAAYEHRIAELEKELAVRGEENRELLKAKIETMRKQLEAERGKNRVSFN
jgi:membrane-associated HD superfamily phosphohydrolase